LQPEVKASLFGVDASANGVSALSADLDAVSLNPGGGEGDAGEDPAEYEETGEYVEEEGAELEDGTEYETAGYGEEETFEGEVEEADFEVDTEAVGDGESIWDMF